MGDGSIFSGENRKFRSENQMVLLHSVWEPSENTGCDLRRCNFSYTVPDLVCSADLG